MACIFALSKRYIDFTPYSLDENQTQVVDHIKGVPVENETRNMLVESARITRKPVKNLQELNYTEYQGLVLPGGFGVAKNFMDYAFKGHNFTVNETLERTLKLFRQHNIPIASCCISPLLLAKVFGKKNHGPGITLTLGKKDSEDWPHSETIGIARNFGNHLEEVDTTECVVDKVHKIVTSPAYMKATASPNDIFIGIDHMIDALNKLMH